MSDQFWIRQGNHVTGPYSVAQMKELASSSRICPDDEISKDGNRWIAAAKVRALKLATGTRGEQLERPDTAGKQYWVRAPGQAHGPYWEQELKALVCQGLVRSGDQVSVDRRHWNDVDTICGSPASPRQVSATSRIVHCPTCWRPHQPGVTKCINCNTRLMPAFLGVFTIVGLVLTIPSTVGALVLMVPRAEMEMPYIEAVIVGLVQLAIYLTAIVVLVGLRRGRYWAWIGIQVLLAVALMMPALVYSVLFVLDADYDMPWLLIIPFIGILAWAFLISPWWIYIRSDKVKTFCSAGRRVE